MLSLWRTVKRHRLNQLVSFFRYYKKALKDSQRILDTISPDKNEGCRKLLQECHDYRYHFEPRDYLIIALYRAYLLNLHRSKPIRILDISTGCGYFPYVCSFFGHNVLATDVDTNHLYNGCTRLLGVNRLTWKIRAYERAPYLGSHFDLVTAFLVSFNGNKEPWGKDEWHFFLSDLWENCLHGNSRVFLGLNPIDNTDQYYDSTLKDFFLDHGARLHHKKDIYFKSMISFRRQ